MYVSETIEELIIGGRKCTVTTRANRPSLEAIQRFAQGLIITMAKVDERNKRAGN